MRSFSFLLFFGATVICHAVTVKKELHINSGVMTAADSVQFYYLSFNETVVFSQKSTLIKLQVGDTLELLIYNHDSTEHNFYIQGDTSKPVAAGDSISLKRIFKAIGVWMFYDDRTDRVMMNLGLAGTIAVHDPALHTKNFYWNIRSHEKALNDRFGNGFVKEQYDPDYYSINGQSFPVNEMDSTAKITGNVGDTIRLHICNSSYSTHAIHFHGYHGKVVATTSKKLKPGWIKDSFPVESKETLIIEIVPDKPGLFPVHDHNLVALASGSIHPNGMLIMMEVK